MVSILPEWNRQEIGRLQDHPGVPEGAGERQRFLVLGPAEGGDSVNLPVLDTGPVGQHTELGLEGAEGSRAGTTPCVDGLEGIPYGCHGRPGCPLLVVRMEDGGQEKRLGGGGVLVLIQEYVGEPSTIMGSDGGESVDKLESGYGEVAELGHVGLAFGLLIVVGQGQELLPGPDGPEQPIGLIETEVQSVLPHFPQLELIVLVAVLLRSSRPFQGGFGRFSIRYGTTTDQGHGPIDEGLVPLPYPGQGLVEVRAVPTDHGGGQGMGDPQDLVDGGFKGAGTHVILPQFPGTSQPGSLGRSAEGGCRESGQGVIHIQTTLDLVHDLTAVGEDQVDMLGHHPRGQLKGPRSTQGLGVLVHSHQKSILADD